MEAIEYSTGTYYTEPAILHRWMITDADGLAAALYVSMDDLEIMNIEVREDRRGEGLARALYKAASEQMEIFHAPESHRTEDGNGFAHAVGGPALECRYGCCEQED